MNTYLMRNKYWLLASASLFFTSAVWAAAADTVTYPASQAPATFSPDNPTDAYSLNNAEATKTADGLVWQRCLLGQTFKNNACSGNATEFTNWNDALNSLTPDQQAAGWRIPNIKELMRISESTRAYPGINDEVFVFAKQFKFTFEKNSPKGARSPSSAFLYSSTAVAHKVIKTANWKAITKTESAQKTDEERQKAAQFFAFDVSQGTPKRAYKDGKSRGEHEAGAYYQPDPDHVEKARYVLLVKDAS